MSAAVSMKKPYFNALFSVSPTLEHKSFLIFFFYFEAPPSNIPSLRPFLERRGEISKEFSEHFCRKTRVPRESKEYESKEFRMNVTKYCNPYVNAIHYRISATLIN
ncbi:hypothetical protein CEXT_198981 [Caerostris extrusa]|uniref:Uncharacterized protein n=1 Tax=Caerostris extrusa TaxID=172846 RepID=A0AAV4WU43_CAEEX|nr:hypothetical protein CEXT_198981 [Caerostris extrusa]